jgi:uncharacterized protein YecT (DUF1311 family)
MLSLLLGSALVASAHAQQAPPTQPAQFQNPIPPGQLAFLNGYVGHTTKELLKDKQFRAVMKLSVPHTEYHYGRDMPLSDAIDDVLHGSPLPVNIRDGRYVTVMGMQCPYLNGRGFMWFDLQEGVALGTFYFTPTNGEQTPTVTVFSRQLNQDAMSLSALPKAFVEDLGQWSAIAGVSPISPRYFIPTNGKKYALLHDEDFCAGSGAQPPSPQDACMQANLAAANADMNAAYFMKETHNAANATAWMLDPEQTAWLALRESSCAGPNALGCRVRMTRERTRVILQPVRPSPRPVRASR